MLKCGISGQTYRLIKDSYADTRYCIKTPFGLTNYFKSNSGVKQGCNLSPLLSNIYQNDLHDISDKDCDPVSLDGYEFNSLSWADDLTLISLSHKGLQKALDCLNTYCEKWDLEVNTEKSKCMVISRSYCNKVNFTFSDCDLELIH